MSHKATWTKEYDFHEAWKVDADPEYRAAWNEEHKRWRADYNTCAECGSVKLTLRNHSAMWGDGDLYCANGHYVRMWDSG